VRLQQRELDFGLSDVSGVRNWCAASAIKRLVRLGGMAQAFEQTSSAVTSGAISLVP